MARSYDFDVVVVGAGIAGMVSAVTATGLGKRVAVVETRKVGGNCTNFTCIPSKTLIRLTHANREMSRLASLGLIGAHATGLDGHQVMAHIRSVVQKAYEKDVPESFEHIGITCFPGPARLWIAIIGRRTAAKYPAAISSSR
jgi:pyruvate/2-oxoglutarate dehydrogenase complex dihydrolipoamide dehydrogenase (E3) component